MTSKPILLALAFLAPVSAASAEEIVVTGAGLDPMRGEAAYDLIAIDRDRLLLSASGRMEDALREAAGFQQFRRSDARSAHPTSQGATLRGLGGNASSRALVLLDGVPLADPFGGWVNWAALDPSRFEMVRVTRGGGSGAGGPGALAGTIALESLMPGDETRMEGEALYGSRDAYDARLIAAGPLGEGHAMISGRYQRGDGFVPVIASQRGAADRAAPYEQGSFSARAVVPVGDTTELQANGLVFNDERERGTAFTRNLSRGIDTSLRLVGRGDWGWEAAAWLQIRDFASQFASVAAGRVSASQSLDQDSVPATGLGARIAFAPPTGEAIDLRFGGDVRQNSGETNELYFFDADGNPSRRREAGGRSRTAGAFADLSASPDDALTLTAGARIDRWWLDNGRLIERQLGASTVLRDDRPADRDGWETTARAGIAWRPAQAVTLRGAGYIGWRLPTLNELYRPFRVGSDTTTANPALRPEKLKGVDAGVEYQPLPALSLRATLFYNWLDDAIGNVTIAQTLTSTTRQRQNLDSIRSRGAEIEGAVTIGQWSAGLSYAYTDARVRAAGAAAALSGLRPAQTPKHQASAHLAWRDGARLAALTLRYVSDQAEDDQNLRILDDAVTLDANLAWPLSREWALVARGENLTDSRVEAGISGSGIVERATPRSLWIGVRYSLR